MRGHLWTLIVILVSVSGEYLMGGHLDNNAEIKSRSEKIGSSLGGSKSHVDNLDLDPVTDTVATVLSTATDVSSTLIDNDVPRYRIPYPFAFNGGKPFSLEKDPITGKIDFEKAPPVRALNYTGRYQEHKSKESKNTSEEGNNEEDAHSKQEKTKSKDDNDTSPNEITIYTPNFHDFLNLPVHYSSDKYGNDKYPLISSSYANTKVQNGANSYSTYNHRPYHRETELYVQPTRKSYISAKINEYNITTINSKTKLTNSASSSMATSFATPTVASPSQVTVSTRPTRQPTITTWKPSTTPIAFYSIADEENEENTLGGSIKGLQASTRVETPQNLSNVPARSPNDEAMMAAIHYKDQSTIDNFVLSHVISDTKLSMQDEEYRDSYDSYEPSDGEDDNGESDYFLPFKDLSKEDVTFPTTTSSITASASITDAASSTASTTTPISVSSILPGLQRDVFTGNPLQFPMISQHPVASSSTSNVDREQNVTDSYDGTINHEYKAIEHDRTGAAIVVESTSNIVIPPDRDTVSFVLGNRQNVRGDYYSIGTAIGENPYGSLSDIDGHSLWPLRTDNSHGPTKGIKYEHPLVSIAESGTNDRIAQKWWPSASSNVLKNNNELEMSRYQDSFVGASDVTPQNIINQDKDSSYVTFPNVKAEDKSVATREHPVIINETDGVMFELSSEPVITTMMPTATTVRTSLITIKNNTKIDLPVTNGNLPQLAENLMPPVQSAGPPSYYYNYQSETLRPDHSRPQRLPPRGKPHSGHPPPDAGSRRRPYSPDAKLPNILPQFRPNAKASHGHRGSDVIGTIAAGPNMPTRIRQPLQNHPPSRRPFPPPPSYLQRLNPPPPPVHAVRLALVSTSKADNAALPHETDPTIRKFRPSSESTISRGTLGENVSSNRLLGHGTAENDGGSKEENQDKSETVIERENENSEKYPEEPPMTPPRPPLFPKRRTADVTTLQMIQHHGEFGENEAISSAQHFLGANVDEDTGSHLSQLVEPTKSVVAHEAGRRKSDNYEPPIEQPVYVVYPVNTAVNIHPDDSREKDGNIVMGTRGPHRPLPPDTLLQDEREKAHSVYDGRPVDFPYPLERPDPSSMFPGTNTKETPLLIPSEQRQPTSVYPANEEENMKSEQDTINVIPYLQDVLPYQKKNNAAISVTLHRTASTSTSTPIAYVYTPTHAAHPTHRLDNDVDVTASVDATATILLPSQQPSSSSSSAPAPQNFMAPFVASVSAEEPTKNGWNVVVVESSATADKRIDSDSDDTKAVASEYETQTEKNEFDADNFKPQLFGGFKPIYEFPTEDTEHRNVADTNTETDMPRHSKNLLPIPDKG